MHWFAHILGIDSQLTFYYAFYSGFGPFLLGLYACALNTVMLYLVFNCHILGCLRVRRYHAAGGDFRVCRMHHPDDDVRSGLTPDHVRKKHHGW